MSDESKAAECAEAFKPLADAAAKLMPNHSPTPWAFDPENYGESREPGWGLLYNNGGIVGVTVHAIAWRNGPRPENISGEARANAEFIVRAVNCHDQLIEQRDALLAACKAVIVCHEAGGIEGYTPAMSMAYDAIAVVDAHTAVSAAPVVSASAGTRGGEEDERGADGGLA